MPSSRLRGGFSREPFGFRQPLTIHIGITGLQRGIEHPEPLLSTIEHADRLGYDSVWFNEQHFAVGIPGAPSALLLAAAALARTRQIRVGLSVVVLPMYHPVMLAEMLETETRAARGIDFDDTRGADGVRICAGGFLSKCRARSRDGR